MPGVRRHRRTVEPRSNQNGSDQKCLSSPTNSTIEGTRLQPNPKTDLSFDRRLGTIENELKHHTKDIAEHAAALKELLADRRSIKQRVETLERDASAGPKGLEESIKTLRTGLAELTVRVESLEARQPQPETKAPRRADRQDNGNSTRPPERAAASRDEAAGNSSFLDSLF